MCQPSWHARANTGEMISLGLIAKRQGLIANHLGLIDVPQVLLNLPYCSNNNNTIKQQFCYKYYIIFTLAITKTTVL